MEEGDPEEGLLPAAFTETLGGVGGLTTKGVKYPGARVSLVDRRWRKEKGNDCTRAGFKTSATLGRFCFLGENRNRDLFGFARVGPPSRGDAGPAAAPDPE